MVFDTSAEIRAAIQAASVTRGFMHFSGNVHHGGFDEALDAAAAELLRAKLVALCPQR